jgi:hypothetical protein
MAALLLPAASHAWSSDYLVNSRQIRISGVSLDYPNQTLLLTLNGSFDYVNTTNNMTDLRFYLDDNTTQLNYWRDMVNTSGYSFIYVQVPNLSQAVSGTQNIYMYYRNVSSFSTAETSSIFSAYESCQSPTDWAASGGTVAASSNYYMPSPRGESYSCMFNDTSTVAHTKVMKNMTGYNIAALGFSFWYMKPAKDFDGTNEAGVFGIVNFAASPGLGNPAAGLIVRNTALLQSSINKTYASYGFANASNTNTTFLRYTSMLNWTNQYAVMNTSTWNVSNQTIWANKTGNATALSSMDTTAVMYFDGDSAAGKGGMYVDEMKAYNATYPLPSIQVNGYVEMLSINMSAWDESSYAPLGNITISFSNLTYASTISFNSSTLLTSFNFPTGQVMITAYHNSVSRLYMTNNINLSSLVLSFYFPTASTSSYYSLQALAQSTPISNATITITKYISPLGQFQTVSQGVTGIDGIFPFYAEPNIQYTVTITHPSYQTQSFVQIFSTNPTVQIQMLPISTGGSFGGDLFGGYYDVNLTLRVSPNTTYMKPGNHTNLTYADNASLTSWVALNITWYNTTNTTNASLQKTYDFRNGTGQSYNYDISLNFTGRYNYTLLYYRNGTIHTYYRVFVASNYTNMLDVQAISDLGGPSVLFFKMLTLFVMVFIAAVTFRFLGIGVLMLMPIFVVFETMWNIWTIQEAILIIGLNVVIIYAVLRGR